MKTYRLVGDVCLAGIVAIGIVNLLYGFAGTMSRLGEYRFVSASLSGKDPMAGEHGNRFADTALGRCPLPVPSDFVTGIDLQWRDFECLGKIRHSYLCGEWSESGWWYYYLVALLVKLPSGLLLVLLVSFGASMWNRIRGSQSDERWWFYPAAVIVIGVSAQRGFNHHGRYVLPAVGFLIVGAAKGLMTCRPTVGIAGAGLMCWAAISGAAIHPHQLAFFNELAGGPSDGHRWLLDSNLDLGQDWYLLRDWIVSCPDRSPVRFAGWHLLSPATAGIRSQPFPSNRSSGWYVISVNLVQGMRTAEYEPDSVAYIREYRPVGRIGYTLWVYRLEDPRTD
ncbi:MAG: hypothetical protein ACJ8C4_06530 [Gemmataceae bacterium]